MTAPHAAAPEDRPDGSSQPTGDGARTRRRYLPPAYSPLPLAALVAGGVQLATLRDRRAALREHLTSTYDAAAVGLLDSGTHALEIALRVAARMVPEGSGIALPAYACFDLATAAVATGLPLTLYDVVPETLAPDRASLAAAVQAGARVIVVAPLYGMVAPWDELRSLASDTGAVLVEDAAQGVGASWRGERAGRHADLSVLSFGRGKGWTGGSGGALLARGRAAALLDDVLAGELHPSPGSLAILARATAMSAFVHPSVFALAAAIPWLHLGETRYHAPTPPRGLPRTAASLLLASARASSNEAAIRRTNAAWYAEALPGVAAAAPIRPLPDAEAGYLRYPLLVRRGMDGFPDPARARALGIAPGYPNPLAELLPVRTRLVPAARDAQWPGAEALCRQLITLPTHSLVRPQERRAIVGLLERYPA